VHDRRVERGGAGPDRMIGRVAPAIDVGGVEHRLAVMRGHGQPAVASPLHPYAPDHEYGFLAALIDQTTLEQAPFSGHVFVFRGRRGDTIKVLWWSGDGVCLLHKRLEQGHFVWPQATSGSVVLTQAQLSMLLEGIDWRQPKRTWVPQAAI